MKLAYWLRYIFIKQEEMIVDSISGCTTVLNTWKMYQIPKSSENMLFLDLKRKIVQGQIQILVDGSKKVKNW